MCEKHVEWRIVNVEHVNHLRADMDLSRLLTACSELDAEQRAEALSFLEARIAESKG